VFPRLVYSGGSCEPIERQIDLPVVRAFPYCRRPDRDRTDPAGRSLPSRPPGV